MKRIIWNDGAGGNVEHIEEHGLTVEDVEYVLDNPENQSTSRASGLPCGFGHTPDNVHIMVVFEEVDEDTVYPVTAYEVPGP